LVNNNRQYQKARSADPMTTDKARELAQQIETSVAALAAETDAARRSDIFREWLNAMAQFHNYSWNNQLLIAMQCPTATRVAGFNTWRKLNRFVRKGEKGIVILAPCIYKSNKRDESKEDQIDEQTRAAGTLRGFRATHVFDISATDGQPLCDLPWKVKGDCADLLPNAEQACRELGIELEYKAITDGAEGYSLGGRIQISETLGSNDRVAVIIHELAHEILHKQAEIRKNTTRQQRELEAESTSFVVLSHFGIQHGSPFYLAAYDVTQEMLTQALATISRAAKRIIDLIETRLPGEVEAYHCEWLAS
jgi:antirestriction protein ArdC